MRKYLWLLGLCALALSSCVSVQDYARLEERIAVLEKARGPARDTMLLAEQAGARKFWWRNGLTGGGDALDGIAHTSLSDGDSAFVMTKSGTTMNSWLYVYNATDTTAEDGTNYTVIAPNSGGGRWWLVNFNGASIVSRAAAGYHYINVTNAGAPSFTPSTGDCYFRQDTDSWCCYDGGWLCEVLTTP